MHALIIEDSYLIATAIADDLRRLGFKSFDLAAQAGQAVAAAKVRRPDLITADARLTDSNGVTAVEEICAEMFIPVVFIVGEKSDVIGAMAGAPIVLKPYSAAELKVGVWDALGRVRAASSLPLRSARHPNDRLHSVPSPDQNRVTKSGNAEISGVSSSPLVPSR